MRFHGLDLNLLVALHALLKERSVSGAAEKLCMTQPAMSQALSRLRTFFDDELLIPKDRMLLLTPRAEALITPVRDALRLIDQSILHPVEFDALTSTRRFALLASDYSLAVVGSAALCRMKQSAPHIGFEVAYPRDVDFALERGELDLIILPQQFMRPEHPTALLFEDEYVVAVWSGSALARETLDLERYFVQGHVAARFDRGSSLQLAEGPTLSAPRPRRVELIVPSFTLVPPLLVGTELIATMPKRLAEQFAQRLPLTLKPPPFDTPKIREMAQWHNSRATDQGIAWIIENLLACMRAPTR